MKLYIFLIVVFFSFDSSAQFFNDELAKSSALRGLDLLYNFEFDKAKVEIESIRQKYPQHPVSFLLSGIQIDLENIPLENNPNALNRYIIEQTKCRNAAKKLYDNPKYKKEAILFLLASEGFLALTKNYQGKRLDAVIQAKNAYQFFKEGKSLKQEIPEFYFSSGLYNYYIIQYPLSHPIVKPMMWVFEGGNKSLGIYELETASRNAIFTKVEASMYLIHILLKYESNFKKALLYSNQLYDKYPRNYTMAIKHAECLLLNAEFNKAEVVINSFKNKNNPVTQIADLVFKGFIAEKQAKKTDEAVSNYAKALKIKGDERYTKDYHAMAYLGLAKFYIDKKDKSRAKLMLDKCLDLAEYYWIIKEANLYLSKIN